MTQSKADRFVAMDFIVHRKLESPCPFFAQSRSGVLTGSSALSLSVSTFLALAGAFSATANPLGLPRALGLVHMQSRRRQFHADLNPYRYRPLGNNDARVR